MEKSDKVRIMLDFSPSHETLCQCGGGRRGEGDRGVTMSRFPNPVLPPPVLFCPFVSQLPPFIVFLPLSCKSCCLTPYSNRECFGLVQNKKMCCKSNHIPSTQVYTTRQNFQFFGNYSRKERVPRKVFNGRIFYFPTTPKNTETDQNGL